MNRGDSVRRQRQDALSRPHRKAGSLLRTEAHSSPEHTPCIFEHEPLLLAAFRGGEDAAFSAVYRRYSEAVGAYLSNLARTTGAHELAQPSAVADLLQEVFVRAFSESARRSYDEQRPYGPYLNTIAKNCFIDFVRKRRRDLACELHDPRSFDRRASAWRSEEAESNVLVIVEDYVSRLSAPLRAVYEQRFAIGLTQKAACEALGVTRRALRTAETHLKRGVCEALSSAGVIAPSLGGGPQRDARESREKPSLPTKTRLASPSGGPDGEATIWPGSVG